MGETLVRMPRLADTLVEGTLGRWLKQVGETVSQGEPLASIETDKVTTEISSPEAGTLLEMLVGEGETVPVETPIARLGAPGAAVAAAQPPPRPTPVAARLLAEHGLEAHQITTRPGRLTKQDVLQYLQSAAPAATRTRPSAQPGRGAGSLVALTPMRRAIAAHLSQALLTIPHGQTVMAADLTRLVAWRDLHKQAFLEHEGANLTFTVFFVYALARVLNSYVAGPVNLGVAVALNGGLIVPVLTAADELTLGATAQCVADLVARARANKLTPAETSGAQMTVTNVGSFGNLLASPIVPMGQVGILGPGLVERRPLPGPDGGVRLGWRCLLSLMCDRRALDDFTADRLLRSVVETLERDSFEV
ncbi:MAG: 2-oxo acid dehydrogenase subunit E2 [Chloroflexi bacterium]|nr:2-oxo acid dehydrogenase subunit E2 [Chloroflexota bacterium]